jgi:hypothetical protein
VIERRRGMRICADSSDVLELLLFCVFVGVLYVSWSSDF